MLDFGIARLNPQQTEDVANSEERALPADRLTLDGGVLGTIGYMSPEQHARTTVDAAFKAYFHPQARGRALAPALARTALQELGFPQAWPLLEKLAAARGPESDELKYFALDLTSDRLARVKVYFLHPHATPAELASACRTAQNAVDLARLRERAHGLRWASVPADVIPLTAAEPDFPVALPIREAVKRYLDGGLLGYAPPEGLPELRQAAASMLVQRRGLHASPAEIFATDCVASGMHIVARLVLKPGDEAIIFDPVDFLFQAATDAAGGRALRCEVDPISGAIDLAALATLVTPRTEQRGPG